MGKNSVMWSSFYRGTSGKGCLLEVMELVKGVELRESKAWQVLECLRRRNKHGDMRIGGLAEPLVHIHMDIEVVELVCRRLIHLREREIQRVLSLAGYMHHCRKEEWGR